MNKKEEQRIKKRDNEKKGEQRMNKREEQRIKKEE